MSIRLYFKFIFLLFIFFTQLSFSNKVIKLTTDPWCPFACGESGDRGYMIDLVEAIFKEKGYLVGYKTLPFARAIFAVENGDADAIVGIQKSEKRKTFIFPEEEQGRTRSCFYALETSDLVFNNANSLYKKRVGTIVGYLYGEDTDALLKNKNISIQEKSGEDALKSNISMLRAKRLDAVVQYETVMNYFIKNNPMVRIKNIGCAKDFLNFYIAFSPKGINSQLYADTLSKGMQELRKSGKLNKILFHYGLTDWK